MFSALRHLHCYSGLTNPTDDRPKSSTSCLGIPVSKERRRRAGIEPGDNRLLAGVGQLPATPNKSAPKKWASSMPITRVRWSSFGTISRALETDSDSIRWSLCETISSERVALVEDRFERPYPLASDARAPQAADQFFAFTRKHWSANHFHPPNVSHHHFHVEASIANQQRFYQSWRNTGARTGYLIFECVA
jgi:hypothetical protein